MGRPPLPRGVTEIIRDRLYAVGGVVPAERPTTWIEPHLRGLLAVGCYVLRDGDDALLVDTGLAVHRPQITSGVGAVLSGSSNRSLIMTRREPDAIINLPWLIKTMHIDHVYCGGVLSPLDFFERADQKNAEAHINALAQTSVTWLQPGSILPVGSARVDVQRTMLSVLPKSHVYEAETRTLFGSDSWGFLTQDSDAPLGIVREIDDRLSCTSVARYLRHKFDWLLGIDTTPVEADLAKLLDLDIERICPAYGCVVEGGPVVRHLLSETIEAVRMLSRETMADRMRGFSHEMFAQVVQAAPAS